MKSSHVSAALLAIGLALSTSASAVTFSVYKASAALPLQYEAINANFEQVILKKNLTTKHLINLALGVPSTTPVPKNLILACAGPNNFSFSPNQTAAVQIIVWDTDANGGLGGKVAKIGDLGTRNLVEQDSKAYKRVGVSPLTFAAVGLAGNRIISGDLDMQGILSRSPTPAGPKPTIKGNGGGKIVLERDGLSIPLAIVHKASISTSGLPIGTFIE